MMMKFVDLCHIISMMRTASCLLLLHYNNNMTIMTPFANTTTRTRRSIWLVLTVSALLCLLLEQVSAAAFPSRIPQRVASSSPRTTRPPTIPLEMMLSLRGGGGAEDASKKTKKKSKTKAVVVVEEEEDEEEEAEDVQVDADEEDEDEDEDEESTSASDDTATSSSGKNAINEAMKEKDAAEALGDAIRDRADILRGDDPFLQSIDWSVGSVGQALGASDRIRREGGMASQSSVIANYFLKSHGGAHGLQCICSALATLSGLGAMALNSRGSSKSTAMIGLTYTMLQRTFLFAMLKHVSGMLAAASVAAKAIPKIGLGQARKWMEQLVVDPVSQYVFFNALLLLWLPGKSRVVQGACWWWPRGKLILPVLLGPILIREVISNLMVISDVLVLWSVGGKAEDSSSSSNTIETVLKIAQSVVNAGMSVLVTPTVWRSADPAQRQAILSKLVSRVSLVLEVAIGAFLALDAVVGLFGAAFLSGTKRPPFRESLVRLICVRLYLHFLLVRKDKIKSIALKMRGGASQLPFYILDVLYEPGKAMGIERPNRPTNFDEMAWWDKLAFGLGLTN